jgi:holo-[acyl-carrier protein] synthase
MKIYQGIDIVEITKFRTVIQKHENFIPDIFTERERNYCLSMKNSHIHFAGRFAAKEASLKALGIGISGTGIDNSLKDVEVIPTPSGKPCLSFGGWAAKVSNKKHIDQLTVSITHSSRYAVATAILVGK